MEVHPVRRIGSKIAALLIVLLALVGCGSAEVSRAEWEAMDAAEKELVVQSLLGGEAAAAAKGGEARRFTQEPAAYVAEIDRRYAAGETRSVEQLWPQLADQ